jgi:hypothetical protein
MHKLAAAVICAMGLGTVPAKAVNEFEGSLRALAEADLSPWAADPAIVAAVRAQNAAHASLTQADIDAMDGTWRAEVGASAAPLIASVMEREESSWLRERKTAAAGLITEVFVMDNRGLNVAQSDVTSDYWQGDEPKWQETFGAGPGAMHLSEVELDESTQTYQSQVSLTVVDPESGAAIGAITFGIDLTLLQ